jgi:hypothetical protein
METLTQKCWTADNLQCGGSPPLSRLQEWRFVDDLGEGLSRRESASKLSHSKGMSARRHG